MKSITIENKTTKTKLEVKIFKDSISFFVLPRKYSKYWIPILATDEQYKIIKKELSNKT